MIVEELREAIAESHEDAILLDPTFDNSIIGVSTSGQVVYNLNLMSAEMAADENITEEEALEFIEYNTIRAIPYMPDPKPIVVIPLED